MFPCRRIHPVVGSFFVLWFIVAQVLVPDYGVTWDEFAQRHHGLVVLDAANGMLGQPLGEERRTKYDLADYPFRYHGLLFTSLSVVLEEVLGLTDDHAIYELRHRLISVLFWIAGMFFYLMLEDRFRSWRLALFGVVLLVCSPRIFADSFNNPKDMVFLPFYLISGFTLLRFLERPSTGNGLAHGLAMALAVSSRLIGLILPVITLALFSIMAVIHFRRQPVRPRFRGLLACAVSFALFSYLGWPALWGDVVAGLREISAGATSFKWDKQILFNGEYYEAGRTPWFYLPVWIGLTTPPLYLLLMVSGCVLTLGRLLRRVRTGMAGDGRNGRTDLVWLVLGVLPLITVVLTGATVYDGWRHLYFTYPFLIALAVSATGYLMQRVDPFPLLRWSVLVVLGSAVGMSAWFMMKAHPNQQVYFNGLAGRDVELRYDVDYWGASYRVAYERLAEIDPAPRLVVTAANYPGLFNWQALPEPLRNRFTFTVNREEATYYLTNYREVEEHEVLMAGLPPFDRPVHVFSTGRARYMGIYRLR